jgi:hypothetical protein
MKLIYIHEVGSNWTEEGVYQFLFTENIEAVDGDLWDVYPASGRPSPPSNDMVDKCGTLTTKEITFTLIQESDAFAVWDAVDGVVALAYEDISEYSDYPESRLYFKFGEDIKSVVDKLYEKDMVLEYTNLNKTVNNED